MSMKVFRFYYSPYCLKVEKALELMDLPFERVNVPYLDRSAIVDLTGGYIHVPVLVDDAGQVRKESKSICEFLVSLPSGERLVPKGLDAAIWAYHDWCDNQLEDVIFRIASPLVRRTFKSPQERAFFTLIKERKFGQGCLESWEEDSDNLLKRARKLLNATEKTLSEQAFVMGEKPSLADAALFGEFAMLDQAGRDIGKDFGQVFHRWFQTLKT